MSDESVDMDPTEPGHMTSDTHAGEVDEQTTPAGESSEAAEERVRQSDELACKLAYECGWRLCDDALRTLEAQRTRAVALLSFTMVAAGVAVSVFLRDGFAEELGCAGVLGWLLFAAGAAGVAVSTVAVAWPLETKMGLGPVNIIENYVESEESGRTPSWVHEHLARNLHAEYDERLDDLRTRNRFYKWSVGCAPVVLAGAGIVVLDVVF